jgi:hypothetical protein
LDQSNRRKREARNGCIETVGAPVSELSEKDLLTPNTVVQLGVTPRRIDVLTSLTGVHYAEAEASQRWVTLEGLTVPVIGISELIRNKKAVGRPQDQADAARLEELLS